MASRSLALIAAALVLLMASGAANPADAGRSGQGFSGGRSFGGGNNFQGRSFGGGNNFQGRSFGGGSFQGRSQFRAPALSGNRPQLRSYVRPPTNLVQRPRTFYGQAHPYNRRIRRHRRILVGVPVIYGGYYYYYGGCDWLRRRALATGSLYWWDRYDACVHDGY